MATDEFRTIAALQGLFTHRRAEDVIAGIGDDGAVLRVGKETLVATVDAQHEGVHFERAWCSFGDIGYRSMVAAASDCIAMGVRPKFALSAVAFAEGDGHASRMALFRGQREACEELGIALVGGNLSRASTLSVTTTVFGAGSAQKSGHERSSSSRQSGGAYVMRSGARPGDLVCVLGTIGHARVGLLELQMKKKRRAAEHGLSVWRRPKIKAAWADAVAGTASAAIDVSDGLAQDLSHMAKASGVSIELQSSRLLAYARRTGLFELAANLDRSWCDLLLTSGEDYATVFTMRGPPEGKKKPAGAFAIGVVGRGAGVQLDGRPISRKGYRHF